MLRMHANLTRKSDPAYFALKNQIAQRDETGHFTEQDGTVNVVAACC